MLGLHYKSKKELKANIGQPLSYVETSVFGREYTDNGDFFGTGPDPLTRKWFAQVWMEGGLIAKVK